MGAHHELPYAQRLSKLTENKLALWDVCATAIRPGSLDSAITDAVPNDFNALLNAHPHIECIAFNGAAAAQMFMKSVIPRLTPQQNAIRREILPSTSPAHAGMTFEQKLARWRDQLSSFITQVK